MKTGLFFGSFNPIHIGHLAIASYMVEFTDLDKVWFVVSPHNPLKNKESLLDDQQRLKMVKLAVTDDHRFEVCDVEFSLPQPSYTIDTLNHLRNKNPGVEFSIIMGSDGLVTFKLWKKYQQIIDHFKRYVYPRPNTPDIFIHKLENGTTVNAPLLDISSTFIRASIAANKNVRYFVPDNVWKFILSNNLYSEY